MLVRFKVKNFKNFAEELEFDLENIKNYEFSTDAVRDGAVDKCLVYGINGCGKSFGGTGEN